MADSQLCNHAEELVDFLYGEASPAERASFESHLRTCTPCSREMSALRRVRTTLADWEPPAMGLGFRLSPPATVVPFRPSPIRRAAPYLGLAAAAVLVMAAGAAIANLQVAYGPGGLTLRTGWARPAAISTAIADPSSGMAARPVAAGFAAAPVADWQRELARVEARLRQEMASHQPAVTEIKGGGSGSVAEARILARVRTLIEDSEQRQERAQALRFVGFARDMQAQRQADFLRVQRGLGQLSDNVTSAEMRQRDFVSHILRVSSQPRPEKPQE